MQRTPRNSILLKEISKHSKLSIARIDFTAKKISKENNISYRDVLKDLYAHYILESKECSVCFETLTAGVSMMQCPKCNTECCTRCLINYMRSNEVFPVCTNFIKCGTVFDDFILSSAMPSEDLRKHIFPVVKEILWIKKQSEIQLILSRIQTSGFTKERINNPERDIQYEDVILPQSKIYGFVQEFKRLLVQEWGGTRTRSKCSILDLKSKILEFFGGWSPAYTHKAILDTIQQLTPSVDFKTREDVKIFIDYIGMLALETQSIYKLISRQFQEVPKYVYIDIKGVISPYVKDDQTPDNNTPFIFRCVKDNCQGYLSREWTCLACSCKVCEHCHHEFREQSLTDQLIDDFLGYGRNGHVCDPLEVASVKKKMEMTKGCPECGARIHRPWGCKHMFCTVCKTGFDWKTGLRISDSINTNPYFLKWKETGDPYTGEFNGTCDNGVPPLVEFSVLIEKFKVISISKRNADFIMSFRDLIDPELGNQYSVGGFHEQYPENSPQARRSLERHVERFLAGLVSEKKLKDILYRSYRIDQKHHHNRMVIRTLEHAGRELLHSFIYGSSSSPTSSSSSSSSYDETLSTEDLVKSIHSLRKMVNTSFRDVGKVLGYAYGCYINTKLILFTHVSFSDSEMCQCKEHTIANDIMIECEVCQHILAGWFDAGIYATPNLIVDRCDNYDDMYSLYGWEI